PLMRGVMRGGISLSYGQIPVLFDDFSIWTSLLGIVVGGGLLTGIAAVARGGMGMGDIKLLAMLGGFGGWRFALASLFGGALLGSVVGILLVLLGGRDPKKPIPFGPFLSLAAFIGFFY
ncbi:MAG: prepilin peptidase, partial [Syntrophothermus sp.]